MADNSNQPQVPLRIDESKMTTAYANTIRTSTTPDEVIFDFGINLPMPFQGQDGKQVQGMVFSVGSRVVMNWTAAKRMLQSLGGAVSNYEETNGEISIQRPTQPNA